MPDTIYTVKAAFKGRQPAPIGTFLTESHAAAAVHAAQKKFPATTLFLIFEKKMCRARL